MKIKSAGGVVLNLPSHFCLNDIRETPFASLRVAMIRTFSGYWTFPKGRQEPGETLEKTARREVWEEIGLRANIVTELGSVTYPYTSRNGENILKTMTLYLMVSDGEFARNKSEVAEVQWFSLPEAWTRQKENGLTGNQKIWEGLFETLGIDRNDIEKPSEIDHSG